MKIAFRTDASTSIGSGHVMRCAVLAEHLKNLGATVFFLSRSMPGDLCDFLEGERLSVLRLSPPNMRKHSSGEINCSLLGVPHSQEMRESEISLLNNGPFDWLVVDHYALDWRWQQAMARLTKNILVIDDLACRQHSCDILLNHSYLPGIRQKYTTLVSSNTKLLLGPDYFILHSEFHKKKPMIADRDCRLRRILIFYGGVDATNETEKVIEGITNIDRYDIHTDIVITNQNPNKKSILERIKPFPNFSLHRQLPNLADLMAKSNISFGAGGGTTYERLFLGLPSFVTTTSENQLAAIRQMHEDKLVIWLGDTVDVEPTTITNRLIQAINDPTKLYSQSKAMMHVVDGEALRRIERLLISY